LQAPQKTEKEASEVSGGKHAASPTLPFPGILKFAEEEERQNKQRAHFRHEES
jgi:hypothetical protein